MPVINFMIPEVLNKQVAKTVRNRGFASKAEFFRMAAFNYLQKDSAEDDMERLNSLTKAIREEVRKKFKGKKLPSLEEQLKDL
ncbi:MAG TPA: hypothetical protein VJJ22_03525 [Candidatus Paceibacterota bacterium]